MGGDGQILSSKRPRSGIKGVQSLQNLTSYAQEEMTRVVSERTVCYCSNFDLDAAEWVRQYHNLKHFSQNIHKKLGKYSKQKESKNSRIETVDQCDEIQFSVGLT